MKSGRIIKDIKTRGQAGSSSEAGYQVRLDIKSGWIIKSVACDGVGISIKSGWIITSGSGSSSQLLTMEWE